MRAKIIGFALCFPVGAQQPGKVPRIGHLSSSSSGTRLRDAFRQGLRELGYIEGQNVTIEYRYAEGDIERFPQLAAELIRLKADVIVTVGASATKAAKEATATIPIVVRNAGDLVRLGLVASLAKPGGNITSAHRSELVRLSVKHRLPSMCERSQWTDVGCLASYGTDVVHLSRRAAVLVDEILKGAKPADLPVEQPTKFELVINLKTAKQLSLTIPPNVLVRADKVIR